MVEPAYEGDEDEKHILFWYDEWVGMSCSTNVDMRILSKSIDKNVCKKVGLGRMSDEVSDEVVSLVNIHFEWFGDLRDTWYAHLRVFKYSSLESRSYIRFTIILILVNQID